MTRYYDPFQVLNRFFAELDHTMRQVEDEWDVALPTISVPSLTYHSDRRVYSDGNIEKHYVNGVLHRDDGPAVIEYKDGKISKETYFLDGEKVTKEAVEEYKQKVEDEKVHTIYLGNKKYKVNGKKLRELEKLFGLEEEPKKLT
jgi:hypothetical protein